MNLNPGTVGVILLLVLVAFSEVKTRRRHAALLKDAPATRRNK